MTEETGANLDALRRSLKRLVEDEANRPPGKGIDKRRHDRHLYMTEVSVKYVKRYDQVSECPDEFVAITKDVSRSGLSFIHVHQMYVGEVIQVELTVQGARKHLLVRIVRCRRAGLKVFDIAGVFISPEETQAAASSQEIASQGGS
ncbi:MAG: PilZ domain-containing protein [Planctomycetes bacterium]|nr:PilZ domain-containing protein [Planctomycetota bacterium]